MIFVLAGTSEARETVKLLKESGLQVSASVVSTYGYELLASNSITYLKKGAFDKEELIRCLKERETVFLVDATHPFAGEISKLAMEVAAQLDIEYIRVERHSCELADDPLIKKVEGLDEIEQHLQRGQNVFSTLGSKNLPQIAAMVQRAGANLIARVLPLSASLRVGEDLGLKPEQIVALKGPFSKELNKALFKQYGAQVILTKESGDIGGFHEKLTAALDLNIQVIVLCRPKLNYPVVVNSPQELLKYIERKI